MHTRHIHRDNVGTYTVAIQEARCCVDRITLCKTDGAVDVSGILLRMMIIK